MAAPAASTPGAAAPAPTRAPQQGSGFTDFSAYLGANGPESKQLADRIAGQIGTESGAAAAGPTAGAGRADAIDATNTARRTAIGKLDALQTGAGREEFLRDANGPTYTAGEAGLDSALLGRQDMSGLRSQWGPLLQPYEPLTFTPPVGVPVHASTAAPARPAPARPVEPPPVDRERRGLPGEATTDWDQRPPSRGKGW